ncbi:MAG: hypothetical protein U0167_11985 [bacterium]
MLSHRTSSSIVVLAVAALAGSGAPSRAQEIVPPFDHAYALRSLGQFPGVPISYAALVFSHDDPNVLLVGGAANAGSSALYAIRVHRNASGHIDGFASSAVPWASTPYLDGGAAFHPSVTLFVSRYPVNEIGQLRPGSTTLDKVVSLADFGVPVSISGLTFVPRGYPGASTLKVLTYSTGDWYEVAITPDGTGTFDVTRATLRTTIPQGSDAMTYVPPGSPEFVDYRSLLVTEWNGGSVAAYEIDSAGDPVASTRREFVKNIRALEGICADPTSGDFILATSGLGLAPNRAFVVAGFGRPVAVEAQTWAQLKALFR